MVQSGKLQPNHAIIANIQDIFNRLPDTASEDVLQLSQLKSRIVTRKESESAAFAVSLKTLNDGKRCKAFPCL